MEYVKNWGASLSVEKFLFARLSPAKRINNGSFLLHPAIFFSAKRFRPSHKKPYDGLLESYSPAGYSSEYVISGLCGDVYGLEKLSLAINSPRWRWGETHSTICFL